MKFNRFKASAFRGIHQFLPIACASRLGFDCPARGNIPQCVLMTDTIQWPPGEFTIQEAINLNPTLAPAVVREKLAAAIAAKTIVRTQKGDRKIKGKFQVVQ